MITCAAFDVETTGLPLHPEARLNIQPRIIEFGGIVFDEDGNELRRDSFLINPEVPIEAIITKITGIDNKMLADKQPFPYYIERIKRFFAGVDVVAAHNLSFDHFFIEMEFERAQQTIELPPIKLCTVESYQDEYGYRPKLVDLYQDVTGETYKQTHRSMDDVEALVAIIQSEKLLEHYHGNCHLQRQEQASFGNRQVVQLGLEGVR